MTIRAYSPQISVVLRKVVNRKSTVAGDVAVADRLKGSEGGYIDLTPYLGRGSQVIVRRTVRGGDTGMFSISFPDQIHPDLADSIYGLVEAMDVIEIRMARDVSEVASTATDRTRLPIIIRGFVGDVSRAEGMGPDGRPSRTVTITGHDYMKILQIFRVIYLPTMIPGQDLLSAFKLFLNYGVETDGSDTAGAFVKKVIDGPVADFLSKLKSGSGEEDSPVLPLAADAFDSPTSGAVQPFGVQQWEGGTIYDLLAMFGDVGAWNELFVEDRDDGPYVVYRPTPFKTAAGDFVQEGAAAATVDLAADDLMSLTAQRSDADVANYYWVDAPRLALVASPLLQQDQTLEPPPALTGYQNSDQSVFGIRLMRAQTQQGVRYDGKAEDEVKDGEGVIIEMVNEKRRILIENNKDNVVLESGSMTLKGSEKIKAGAYVHLTRGGFEADYYAHEVTHEFTVGVSYTTTVGFDRGTGYLNRLQRSGEQSAYRAEQTIGGAYG